MRDVIVVIGPGEIGQAIARRVGLGKRGERRDAGISLRNECTPRKWGDENTRDTMSALGHKQTFAPQKVMSALPPIATAKADITHRQFAVSFACTTEQT